MILFNFMQVSLHNILINYEGKWKFWPHDRTHISSEVSPAGGGGQVLLRIQPVCVNHEVTISQIAKEEVINSIKVEKENVN